MIFNDQYLKPINDKNQAPVLTALTHIKSDEKKENEIQFTTQRFKIESMLVTKEQNTSRYIICEEGSKV